jgi:pimeloyl-ACP methyl ester carboxylesterase
MDDVATTDDLTLRVHDLGGSGRPVLAAHATGFNGLVWRPLAAALTEAHVIAPDFRAHGGSPVPRDADLDWERFADDVLATLDAVGWSADSTEGSARPMGIGHSMGGAALLLAELRRPGTFAGLWVYEPIIFPPEARALVGSVDHPLASGARRRRPTFASLAAAVETYGSKPPMQSFDRAALEAYVEGGFVDESDGTVRLACRPEDESRIYTTAATCTAFERLAQIECPVWVVRGRIDESGPATIAEPAAAALPQGTLVVHDELSHFGPMEDPAGLATEITASLGEIWRVEGPSAR